MDDQFIGTHAQSTVNILQWDTLEQARQQLQQYADDKVGEGLEKATKAIVEQTLVDPVKKTEYFENGIKKTKITGQAWIEAKGSAKAFATAGAVNLIMKFSAGHGLNDNTKAGNRAIHYRNCPTKTGSGGTRGSNDGSGNGNPAMETGSGGTGGGNDEEEILSCCRLLPRYKSKFASTYSVFSDSQLDMVEIGDGRGGLQPQLPTVLSAPGHETLENLCLFMTPFISQIYVHENGDVKDHTLWYAHIGHDLMAAWNQAKARSNLWVQWLIVISVLMILGLRMTLAILLP